MELNRFNSGTHIRDMILEHFGKDITDMSPKTQLIMDLGLDSLDLVELQMDLESDLKIRTDDDLFTRCRTIAQLMNRVDILTSERD